MRKALLAIVNTLMIALAAPVVPEAAVAGVQLSECQMLERPALSLQDERNWQRIRLKGEEISIETPVLPGVMVNPFSYFSRSYERVFEKRTYSAYAGDLIFVIESYRAKNPQRLLDDMLLSIERQDTSRSDVTLGGLGAKQYPKGRNFSGSVYYVAAKKHVYAITVAAMGEGNSSVARFLSSVKFDDVNAGAEIEARSLMNDGAAQATTAGQEPAFSSREVTRKAVIVWKPEPLYTDEARRSRSRGTIVIKAVLASDGQVTNIQTLNELRDGLTQSAVEAARNIRFFPAEKDGRPVSQSVQLEYNFNVY